MEHTLPPARHPADSRLWLALLLGLSLGQLGLVLTLFGPGLPWQALVDDRPILTGRHPLHLYHGYLGAQSFLRSGTLCCYDPSFLAGYPKTPVFDGGSRPAELFLLLGGGDYRPAAYKVGLAGICLLLPLLLYAAACSAGLPRAAACAAATLAMLVWWSRPGRETLEHGDLDLLLASLAGLAQMGLLLGFDRLPGTGLWLGLLAASWLTWFAQPLVAALLIPLTLIYYLTVGARHRLIWHAALWTALGGGALGNAFWLHDGFVHLWIRAPLEAGPALLPHRTFQTLWSAPLWGGTADRILAISLLALGFVGVVRLNAARQRAAARLLGLGTLTLLALAIAGTTWEPLSRWHTARLFVPALLFAIIPAVHGLGGLMSLLARWTGGPIRGSLPIACLVLSVGIGARDRVMAWVQRQVRPVPFVLGLSEERSKLVAELIAQTTPNARILWEEQPHRRSASLWTALLPVLTEPTPEGRRYFQGGLDPGTLIDHAFATLSDERLAGRPIGLWSDSELLDYCERYNIGWVVCWSPTSQSRFRAFEHAKLLTSLHDVETGVLFAIDRPHTFTRRGQATWLGADHTQVSLGDVRPDRENTVVLSLHYQEGLRVVPARVQIEREYDPDDPIPFVRLRLPAPATRVTLTWK